MGFNRWTSGASFFMLNPSRVTASCAASGDRQNRAAQGRQGNQCRSRKLRLRRMISFWPMTGFSACSNKRRHAFADGLDPTGAPGM